MARSTVRAEPGDEQLGRLVGRVLGDELAAQGSLEDGPADGSGAALRELDRGLLPCRGEERPRGGGNLWQLPLSLR